MKRTQRISVVVLTLIVAMLVVAMFGACATPYQNESPKDLQLLTLQDNEFLIVIQKSDNTYLQYKLAISVADNLYGALEYLNKNNGLELVASDSQYGKFITQVADLVPKGKQFIALYTSVKEQQSTAAYATTINCGGVEVVTADVGASSLSVPAKAVLYIQMEQY